MYAIGLNVYSMVGELCRNRTLSREKKTVSGWNFISLAHLYHGEDKNLLASSTMICRPTYLSSGPWFWWHVIYLSLRDRRRNSIYWYWIWNVGSKNSYFVVHFSSFCVVFKFWIVFVILASFSCHIFKVYFILKSFFFSSFTEFLQLFILLF